MPTPKRLALLAAAFAVVGGLALAVWRRADRLDQARPLASAEPASLYRVEVARQGAAAMTLEKQAGRWRLRAPVEDLADADACEELLGALRGLVVGSRVSDDPARYGEYGLLEADAARVKVYSRERAVAALDGLFGKAALGERTLYFRYAGSKPVYLAEGLGPDSLRAPDDYRERAFFPPALGPLSSLTLAAGARTTDLKKDEPAWATAAALRVADFAAQRLPDSRTGLDRPVLAVEAAGPTGRERWRIGRLVPRAGGKPAFRYARADDRPGALATVAVYDADALLKRVKL